MFSPLVFRAIASPRRTEILKLLRERAHTPTELARRLSLSDNTVRAHLEVLGASGLVVRREDGRRWAYHVLTDEGRALFAREAMPGPGAWVVAAALAALGAWMLVRWRALLPPGLPPGTIGMPIEPDPSLPWLLAGGLLAVTSAFALSVASAIARRRATSLTASEPGAPPRARP